MKRFLGCGFLVCGIILFFSTIFAQYSVDYGTQFDDNLLRQCNRQTAYSTGVSDARKGLARKEDYAQICRTNRALLNSAYNSGYSYGLTNQFGLIVNEPSPNHPEVPYQLPSSSVQPYTRPVQVPGYVENNPNVVRNTTYGPVVPGGSTYSSVGPGGSTSNDGRASRSAVYPGEQGVPSGDLARPDPGHGLRSLIEVAPSARPKCIETVNGEACGYNCINSLNNVRCASTPDQICRSNAIGDIACGYHCISTAKLVRCAAFPTDICVADHNGYVFCGQNCRISGNATAICDIERYAP